MAAIHVYVNCIICGVYVFSTVIFLMQAYKINSFDKIKDYSFLLKLVSLFLVLN